MTEVCKKKSFGIVILNYFSYQESIKCLESFMNADKHDFDMHYVVVDNGSSNGSYDILRKTFENNNDVDVIKLSENLGFANGNNAGCDYLRENYNCDYFIFSNSDILVPENIFIWINNTFNKHKCDLLGPDIYAPNLGVHQNPIKEYTRIPLIVSVKIIKKKCEIILAKFGFVRNKSKRSYEQFAFDDKQIFNHPIHGSFIISNNKIFNFYDTFFDNRTFLYMEEYLLFLRCMNSGLKTMISLDNHVIHLQGKSTDVNMVDYKEKRINRLKREINSMKIYREALKRS